MFFFEGKETWKCEIGGKGEKLSRENKTVTPQCLGEDGGPEIRGSIINCVIIEEVIINFRDTKCIRESYM